MQNIKGSDDKEIWMSKNSDYKELKTNLRVIKVKISSDAYTICLQKPDQSK